MPARKTGSHRREPAKGRLEASAKPGASARLPAAEDAAFAAEIGQLVRLGRAKRGITRRQLAEDSGISQRYLAQIEGGDGNPSVIVLKALARAMDVPIIELLPRTSARSAALTRLLDVLGRLPAAELASVLQLVEGRLAAVTDDRARRIALVGLRGAGKSTLGQMLAAHLGCPFVELNRVVEQDYGARVSLLIEMSGMNTFRRYERACLERVLAEHESVVIAAAGGIVSSSETYELLLRRTHAIWLKARPEDHMNRVMAQGDFRPMAQNRAAMDDLVAILEARRDDYARAEAELDTSNDTPEESFAKLVRLVAPLLEARHRLTGGVAVGGA
jgi:XRE family aerobic/anaerobic benzoate catabolism transcriptional regulator